MARLGVPSSDIERILRQEQKNTETVFEFLMEHVAMRAPFSTDFMKKMHTFLMQDITFDCGEYRYEPVRMNDTGIIPLKPYEISEEMDKMEADYYKSANPIRRILDMNYTVIVSQPFSDGNKRVARLMMNHELMRNGYCPLFIYKENREDYLNAIEQRFLTGKSDDYYNFMLGEMKKTMERSVAVLENTPHTLLRHEDLKAQQALNKALEMQNA